MAWRADTIAMGRAGERRREREETKTIGGMTVSPMDRARLPSGTRRFIKILTKKRGGKGREQSKETIALPPRTQNAVRLI